jgi:hypothetical protein
MNLLQPPLTIIIYAAQKSEEVKPAEKDCPSAQAPFRNRSEKTKNQTNK